MIKTKGTKLPHISMEDNEKNEDVDTQLDEESNEESTEVEETEEELTEDETDDDSDDDSTEDSDSELEKLRKENKTLKIQKDKWRKKADKPATNKPNENQSNSLSREEAILFAKGYTDEEVTLANKLARVNETSILEAVEDNYLKTMRAERIKKEKSNKASLPASSTGGVKHKKPVGEMSEEEHRELFDKAMGN